MLSIIGEFLMSKWMRLFLILFAYVVILLMSHGLAYLAGEDVVLFIALFALAISIDLYIDRDLDS